ncbi:MAG: PLP-dependent transferase, partial [Candidatus Eremiobacteraeota bacterium]|nr:PLP-dependent transferase [Candidatus Eremiobacteraeota bacterium]
MQDRQFGFSTRAIHAGTPPDPVTGSRVTPIYQTAAFVFGSTEQAAELFQ